MQSPGELPDYRSGRSLGLSTSRRSVLGLIGSGTEVLLAGCYGLGGEPDRTEPGGTDDEGTPTAVADGSEDPDRTADGATCSEGGDPEPMRWTSGRDWTVERWTAPDTCNAASDVSFEDLSFGEATSYHARSVLPPALQQRREDFRAEPGGCLLEDATNPASVEATDGTFVVDGNGDRDAVGLWRSDIGPAAPHAAIVCPVECIPTVDGTRMYVGLATEAGEYVAAFYDPGEGKVGIEAAVDDTVETLGTGWLWELDSPFEMAFVYRSRYAKLLIRRPDEGWTEPVNAHAASTFELRDPAVLSKFNFVYGATGPGRVRYGAATMGHAGGLGLRDPGALTWADGTPVVQDGELYIAFTVAGNPQDEGWSSSYFGIFAMDLQTYALRQTAGIFFERDGIVYNDYAGHATIHPETGTVHVFASTWGQSYDDHVHVIHASGDSSLLTGTHVVEPHVAVEQAYDPNVMRIDGTWWMTAVADGRLMSARFTDDSFTEYNLVGRGGEHLIEGPRFQRVGDEPVVVAARQQEYEVYSKEMERLGELDAYHPTEDQEIHPPHPMLLALPTDGGDTRYVLVTFDASGAFDESDGRREIGTFLVLHDQNTLVCDYVHPFDTSDLDTLD